MPWQVDHRWKAGAGEAPSKNVVSLREVTLDVMLFWPAMAHQAVATVLPGENGGRPGSLLPGAGRGRCATGLDAEM